MTQPTEPVPADKKVVQQQGQQPEPALRLHSPGVSSPSGQLHLTCVFETFVLASCMKQLQ